MLLSGDPQLDFVPQTLIYWTIKSVVLTFISQMKAKAIKGYKSGTNSEKSTQFERDIEGKIAKFHSSPKL
jgi:hypothetical protein